MADPPFAMEEMHGWSLVQVAGWHDSTEAVDDAIARLCGIAAPTEVGGVAASGMISLFRVGPGRIWLVDEAGDVAPRMAGAIDDAKGCVTPLGEGRRRFRLSGPRVPDVLQSLVALDPADPSFAPGRVALTMVHRVPVLLHRVADTIVELYLPTTFAASLAAWIGEAAV